MTRDPLMQAVNRAFRETVEAGEIIYAAGLPREIKDEYLTAHSALLALKLKLEAREKASEEARRAAREPNLG